jgi:hypothetical protein
MFWDNLSISFSRVKQSKNNARNKPTNGVTKGADLSRMKVNAPWSVWPLLHLITMLDPKTATFQNNLASAKQHSTVSRLARITDFINHGFNLDKYTGMVLLDIEKTYNTVWLNSLL